MCAGKSSKHGPLPGPCRYSDFSADLHLQHPRTLSEVEATYPEDMARASHLIMAAIGELLQVASSL